MTDLRNACPRCGAQIEASIAERIPAGDTGNGVARVEYEERDCPHCGTGLKRRIGGEWLPASEEEL